MTDPRVTEVMRLASLLAEARCRRLVANTRNEGREGIDQADRRVQARTDDLRTYVEAALCVTPSTTSEPSSATPS